MSKVVLARKRSFPTVTDQFCGAGGSSQAARRLGLEVQLAMNHWQLAIETHNTNFPETHHDCTDISAVDPGRYWPTDILITSPECTNHSIAKGSRRRSQQMRLFGDNGTDPAAERSRATMWDVVRFAETHRYRMIIVENVVDARAWLLFDNWLQAMHTLGYRHHIVYLNSMFAHLRPLKNPRHGDFAPQSRDRMYVVFWKREHVAPDLEIRPLAWCPVCERDVEAVQTWKRTQAVRRFGGRWGRYGNQYYYVCPHCSRSRKLVRVEPYFYAAANAIDWSIAATRIGDRKTPLKARTVARIRKGLEMFSGHHLVVDLSHTHGYDRRSVPVSSRLPTQTTSQTAGLLVLPFMLETAYAGTRNPRGVQAAMATQTARQSQALVLPPLLVHLRNNQDVSGVDDTLNTITAGGGHHGVLMPPFLLGYANGDSPPKGADEPLRTFHTQNGQGVVVPPFMTSDGILPTQTTAQMTGLTLPPFMVSYYGSNGSLRDVGREMGAITTVDRHALVSPEQLIEECGFRMLQPHEIGRGMAFDDGYVVMGNNREKVRQYGNAVTPPAMELLLQRCLETLQ